MDKFEMYIQQGHRAIDSHPDRGADLDLETLASDTIASVLHAVCGRTPGVDALGEAADLVRRALWTFEGDYEDIDR